MSPLDLAISLGLAVLFWGGLTVFFIRALPKFGPTRAALLTLGAYCAVVLLITGVTNVRAAARHVAMTTDLERAL